MSLKKDVKLILKSPFFDAAWYLEQNLDVAMVGMDPARHYLKSGWREGRNPSADFDGNAYLKAYPDVAAAKICPLLHFIKSGKREGRAAAHVSENVPPPQSPEATSAAQSEEHDHGDVEIIAKSALFDAVWYLEQNPDVAAAGADPVRHYLENGWREGRNPSANFDGNAYLKTYPDVAAAKICPLLHFVKSGKKEGRLAIRLVPPPQSSKEKTSTRFGAPNKEDTEIIASSSLFNAVWYLKQNPDVSAAGIDPATHYLENGWKEGRNPSANFDGNAYLKTYPDVAAAKICPLLHFIKSGKKEGRIISFKSAPLPLIKINASEVETIAKAATPSPFPIEACPVFWEKNSDSSTARLNRVVIFASFSQDCRIHNYIVAYLKELKLICDMIIFVADNPLLPGETKKIADCVNVIMARRHGEYDFGSYKYGFAWLKRQPAFENCQELLFCNDSCLYAPTQSFEDLFARSECEKYDFWGLTANFWPNPHLQSYFLVFRKNVFSCATFEHFLYSVEEQADVSQVVLKYETKFTETLQNLGFTWAALFDLPTDYRKVQAQNPLTCPLRLLEAGCPLVKIKAFNPLKENFDGVIALTHYLHRKFPEVFELAKEHRPQLQLLETRVGHIAFSVILATYNRREIIEQSVDSILRQTWKNFELIIVDDGSTDGTTEFLKERYAEEIRIEKIRIVGLPKNQGVCLARNVGLEAARNEWIAYADSDNYLREYALDKFAAAIAENPSQKCFYGKIFMVYSRRSIGKEFEYDALLKGNFIDLGVFVHAKSLFLEFGGFDPRLKRLVDWDLILRYTKGNPPIFIPCPLLDYSDSKRGDRISNMGKLSEFQKIIYAKHLYSVAVCITTYNQEKFIAQAIESALAQKGEIGIHIYIFDDASTDRTPEIAQLYAETYPEKITLFRNEKNLGISGNMKKVFSTITNERHIAILEGDDFWTDPKKLEKQIFFLNQNQDCSMCFHGINILNSRTGVITHLKRHEKLSKKLTDEEIINCEGLNPIANFSGCVFLTHFMRTLPEELFAHRLSEIPLLFWLERKGKIGFIREWMSIYRVHDKGVWSGKSKAEQLQSGYECRQTALLVCADKFKERIRKIVEKYKAELVKIRKKEAGKRLSSAS